MRVAHNGSKGSYHLPRSSALQPLQKPVGVDPPPRHPASRMFRVFNYFLQAFGILTLISLIGYAVTRLAARYGIKIGDDNE